MVIFQLTQICNTFGKLVFALGNTKLLATWTEKYERLLVSSALWVRIWSETFLKVQPEPGASPDRTRTRFLTLFYTAISTSDLHRFICSHPFM